MKRLVLMLLFSTFSGLLCLPAMYAQERQPTMLILSKDASGRISGNTMTLDLRANTSCDQSSEAFPDGCQLIANDLTFLTNDKNMGLVYGSLQIRAPDGRILQTMMLRGTFGLNARRDDKRDCSFEHLEALLEPVPTFAPVYAPQIALAHLSADIIAEAASPLPLYRAKLDGVVTLPPSMNNTVTINPDKTTYKPSESITVIIANHTKQAIITEDLQSYCSIVRLQRQDGENWDDVGPCLMKRRSIAVTIEAGQTKRIVLAENENSDSSKKPGIYRLVLDYTVNAKAGKGSQVISPTFQIN